MKLRKIEEVDAFLQAVNKCGGNVLLRSQYGDCYNLKSALSCYIGIGALLSEHGDELELFCEDRNDEGNLYEFFANHEEVLR